MNEGRKGYSTENTKNERRASFVVTHIIRRIYVCPTLPSLFTQLIDRSIDRSIRCWRQVVAAHSAGIISESQLQAAAVGQLFLSDGGARDGDAIGGVGAPGAAGAVEQQQQRRSKLRGTAGASAGGARACVGAVAAYGKQRQPRHEEQPRHGQQQRRRRRAAAAAVGKRAASRMRRRGSSQHSSVSSDGERHVTAKTETSRRLLPASRSG